MSSSAPGGSLGRVFGLHGNGSDGSKEIEEEKEVKIADVPCFESAVVISWGCMIQDIGRLRRGGGESD